MNLKKLQNGSDIRGVALPLIDEQPVTLGKPETYALTYGFIKWLSNKTGKATADLTICVGRDSRLSGETLEGYIFQTLNITQTQSLSSGLSSTPAMFMSTVFTEIEADGAIMITASHLPSNRNGFKYFDRDGGLNKSDIKEIINYAEALINKEDTSISIDDITKAPVKADKNVNLMDLYALHLQNKIIEGITQDTVSQKTESQLSKNASLMNKGINIIADKINNKLVLSDLHVIVDAGNGAGGFFAEKVLKPLGAKIDGSQFLEPNGNFPNHIPNPEDKEAIESICNAVKAYKPDLGLIFDTDVDRASAVDELGNPINKNSIVAMAALLIADSSSNCDNKPVIVTDSITSDELTKFIKDELGLEHLRFKRGYKNVINKSIELNESGQFSPLAIETSGHAAFSENYFLDDGAYLATKIVIKTALLKRDSKTLSSVLNKLQHPAESIEKRLPINDDNFSDYADAILNALDNWVKNNPDKVSLELPNYEGIRINFNKENGNGWALLRKSLHDPIMPINIESTDVGGSDIIWNQLKKVLDKFQNLDLNL